jgi:hypothetical protein
VGTIRGLEAYDFRQDAADLAFRTVEGVFRTYEATRQIWEFYDHVRFDVRQLRRKRGSFIKRLTVGNRPLRAYGWRAR